MHFTVHSESVLGDLEPKAIRRTNRGRLPRTRLVSHRWSSPAVDVAGSAPEVTSTAGPPPKPGDNTLKSSQVPAILCPSCRQLISPDVAKCPFCGQARPGLWGLSDALRRYGLNIDFSTLILYVCGGLYAASLLIDPSGIFEGGFSNPLMLLAPSHKASLMLGETGAVPVFYYGHWWTLLTAIYLHGSLLHIFFNMMWVRQLVPLIADLFGPFRLFTIYTVSGFTGFLISTFFGTPYVVGASGAVFGLLAAAIVYGRRSGSSMFTRQFVQWAVLLFIMGLIVPRVDNWAHAGGFAGGYLSAYIFSRQPSHEGIGAYLAAGLCALLTLLSFLLQVPVLLANW